MTDIHIPAAALEAGARAILKVWHGHPWELADTFHKDASMVEARACFQAMVKAWPGMHTHEWQRQWLGGMSGTDLILPLTEKPDAE